MTYRTRNILIASGLALLAVVFMLIYISKVRQDTDIGRKVVSVFVAAHDISEGTPGSGLTAGGLVEKRVPTKAVVPGAISTRGEIRGLIATQETLAGEQITTRRFGPLAAAGVRSTIGKTQRVIQLAGSPDQVLDGTLKAGDHVDILATWTMPESCGSCHVSRTIVRNVLVLKTSQELGTADAHITSGDSNTAPVQLRLTDREAERVLWVTENGQWWLDLRPVVKARNSSQGFATSPSILRSGLQTGPS